MVLSIPVISSCLTGGKWENSVRIPWQIWQTVNRLKTFCNGERKNQSSVPPAAGAGCVMVDVRMTGSDPGLHIIITVNPCNLSFLMQKNSFVLLHAQSYNSAIHIIVFNKTVEITFISTVNIKRENNAKGMC